MLSFNPISSLKKGTLFQILYKSYKALLSDKNIINKDKYIENWKRFDKDSFNNLNIGKCVFVTYLNNELIGLASYDPRHFPNYGIIGHNCILPKYQNQGYGKKQIEYLLEIFSKNKCKKVKVETGSFKLYLPAQKMYESLGFKEIGRRYDSFRGYDVIEYEKYLI